VYRRTAWWRESDYSRYDSSGSYFGGGPHLGLTSRWLLGSTGWSIYGRADSAVTFGGGEAKYGYQRNQDVWGGDSPRSESDSLSEFQFDLGMQLGLTNRTEWRRSMLGLTVGVQLDVLTVGNLKGKVNTSGLVNAGPFLRLEIGF